MSSGAGLRALGYSQLTGISASTGITVVAGASTVLIQPEAQNVRYRDDGTAPTATVGMLLIANTIYEFTIAQLSLMRFIQTTSGSILNVSQYAGQ